MIINKTQVARTIVKTAILTFAFCLTASTLYARTFYLSPDGDDGADCVSGAEFRTLERAVSCLAAGDTLFVRNGTYDGGVFVRVQATEEAPVLIQGESLEAIIDSSGSEVDAIRVDGASHIIIDRLTVQASSRAGISVLGSHHVRVTRCRLADNYKWGIFTGFADDVHFEDNECYGAKDEHGIYHSNSGDRFVIRGNLIHHNAANGIHINGDPDMGGDGVNSFGVVEGNIIYGNGSKGGAGINMTHVQDVLVRNNLIYSNYAGGFTVYQDTGTFQQGSKRVVIMGNTVYFRGAGRSCVNIQTTSEKVVVVGNIFVSGGYRGTLEVNSQHLSTIVSDHNILWGVDSSQMVERSNSTISLDAWRTLSGNDTHSRVADPFFSDPDSGDFSIADSSAAVDAGMPLDSVRAILEGMDADGFEWLLGRLDTLANEDILGRPRPVGAGPDAGAYEIGVQPTGGLYDFNEDNRLSLEDAVTLLLLARGTPEDPAVDVNEDGRYSMADVIQLLLIMIDMSGAFG